MVCCRARSRVSKVLTVVYIEVKEAHTLHFVDTSIRLPFVGQQSRLGPNVQLDQIFERLFIPLRYGNEKSNFS